MGVAEKEPEVSLIFGLCSSGKKRFLSLLILFFSFSRPRGAPFFFQQERVRLEQRGKRNAGFFALHFFLFRPPPKKTPPLSSNSPHLETPP